MTKEAKLQAAMRILPEWVGYDEEIKTLQQKVENESKQLEKEERDEHGKLIINFKNYFVSYTKQTTTFS